MGLLHNLTINMMVRDEPYAPSALRAAMHLAERAVVVDTGSSQENLANLEKAVLQYPHRIIFEKLQHPDASQWRHNDAESKTAHGFPGGNIRREMLGAVETEFMWIVDGDEVYPDQALPQLKRFVEGWPAGIDCVFLPLIWFARNLNTLAVRAVPQLGPYLGRFFRKAGLEIKGDYPYETATYNGRAITSWLCSDSMDNVMRLDAVAPFHHLQLVVKPLRRAAVVTRAYDGPQPAQLVRDGIAPKYSYVY